MSELTEWEMMHRTKAENRRDDGYANVVVPVDMFLRLLDEADAYRAKAARP